MGGLMYMVSLYEGELRGHQGHNFRLSHLQRTVCLWPSLRCAHMYSSAYVWAGLLTRPELPPSR